MDILTRKLIYVKLIYFIQKIAFVFKYFVTLVASAMFVLFSTNQSQLRFQMAHGNEVGSFPYINWSIIEGENNL